jgi:DNA-directed RNA polymerase beta' subunit
MAIELSFSLFENAYKLRDVTNPSPLKAGKFKFTEDGLYSEAIFGPLKKNTCSCGALFSKENAGVRCEVCDVLCDTNALRSSTFGRIDLPKNIYIMLPIFQNLLSNIFGQTAIKSLLDYRKYESNKQKPYFYSITQGKLIKGALLKQNEERILKEVYDITTLHKLYRSMLRNDLFKERILNYVSDDKIADFVFVNFILVIPPDSRPLVQMNKQYQAHPITAAYTEILKNIKNSFLDKVYQTNEEGFGQTVYKYQKSVNKLYSEITDKNFQRKESIVRESLAGKTVETSQRATIVPEPILAPGSIGLHEETIKKIFQPELLHFINKKYEEQTEEGDYSITDFVKTVHNQTASNGDIIITDELFEEFLESKGPELRMLLERPPVLWRYNMSGALLGLVYSDNKHRGIKQDRVIGVNSVIAPMFNLDYDGDNLSVYALTSEQSKESFKYLYMENSVEFEHHRGLIPSPEHEAIYAAFILSVNAQRKTIRKYDIEHFKDFDNFDVQIDSINRTPGRIVNIAGDEMPYNIAVINKALGLNKKLYDGNYKLNKKNLNKLLKVLRDNVKDSEFYTYLHNFDKFLLECSTVIQDCNPTFDLDDFSIGSNEIDNYKKTLIQEPYIAFHQNDILFQEIVTPKVKERDTNILAKVFESGARIKSVQLLKAVSNNGIPTNIYGKAFQENIKNSLLDGLTKREFFMGGDSARLALAQRQEAIPKGGELQRKFYYSTGFLKLDEKDDCGSERGFELKIQDKTHLESLYSRYYVTGEEIDTEDLSLIGTYVTLRSPIYCESKSYKVCKKCFGHKQPQSKSLGASIGAYISESIIQSVLRTHHFSGAFITQINPEMRDLIKKLKFVSPNRIYYKDENDVVALQSLLNSSKYYDSPDHVVFEKVQPQEEWDDVLEQEKLGEPYYEIVINELPFNDDSVKQLNNIVSYIDRNRDLEDLISMEDMYNFLLDNVVLPNGILSIFIELVISILYYDENKVMIRYSKLPVDHQIALKTVIDRLDPKLAIFHNFSNKAINRIYTTKIDEDLDHMYFDLISCYH